MVSEESSDLGKVKSLSELRTISENLKKEGKTLVMCHGVFDLVHLGHMRHLKSAKKFGDVLVVTTTADKYVRKGPGRPVFNEQLRAEALANLEVTNFVVVTDFPTAIEAIEAIKPHFYVKGPDYKDKEKDLTAQIYAEEESIKKVGGKIVITDDATYSSSQLINLNLETYPQTTLKYLKDLSSKYTVEDIIGWVDKAKGLKVLVIGDAIIDQYYYCSPMGKSAKENVVAQRFCSSEDFAGGILATANHIAQLSDSIDLVTAIGEHESFEPFIREHLNPKINTHFVRRSNMRTIVKRRYVGQEDRKKLFEVCTIDDQPLVQAEETDLMQHLETNLSKYDLVVVNDFGHGLITNDIMQMLCSNAKQLTLNVQTNSANIGFNLVTKFAKADFICIDEYEMRLATHEKYKELPELVKSLNQQLNCKQVLVTRGSSGSISYRKDTGFIEAPALADRAIDKIGAGDAFFAYTSPFYALGASQELLSFIGNAAGSLKLQITGNREPVKLIDMLKFISRLLKM